MNLTNNVPIWWSNCIHNQEYALRNRYLKSTKPVKLDYELLHRIVDDLSHDIIERNGGKLTTITVKEFLETYRGNLRTRYENGVAKTYLKPKNNIEIFIKDEFYWENKPPRTIFARDYGFNAIYGTITKPLEHLFMNHPEFAKGKNFVTRGHMFKEKFEKFKYFIENDFSKFESSQRVEVLTEIELRLYKNVFHDNEHALIERVFSQKLQKPISSREGINTTVYGCRGSGDMDTSLGNGILNYVACKYFTIKNCIEEKDNLIIDGDDSIIFTNSIHNIHETFSDFGFDCKLIIRKDYHDLDFCSGKFIKINTDQFYYVQNVNKMLDSIQYYQPKNNMSSKQYFYTLGVMYANLYPNFPIFRQISEYFSRKSERVNFAKIMATGKLEHALNRADIEIDYDLVCAEFRTSFNIDTTNVYDFQLATIPNDFDRTLNRETKFQVKYVEAYESIKI